MDIRNEGSRRCLVVDQGNSKREESRVRSWQGLEYRPHKCLNQMVEARLLWLFYYMKPRNDFRDGDTHRLAYTCICTGACIIVWQFSAISYRSNVMKFSKCSGSPRVLYTAINFYIFAVVGLHSAPVAGRRACRLPVYRRNQGLVKCIVVCRPTTAMTTMQMYVLQTTAWQTLLLVSRVPIPGFSDKLAPKLSLLECRGFM